MRDNTKTVCNNGWPSVCLIVVFVYLFSLISHLKIFINEKKLGGQIHFSEYLWDLFRQWGHRLLSDWLNAAVDWTWYLASVNAFNRNEGHEQPVWQSLDLQEAQVHLPAPTHLTSTHSARSVGGPPPRQVATCHRTREARFTILGNIETFHGIVWPTFIQN